MRSITTLAAMVAGLCIAPAAQAQIGAEFLTPTGHLAITDGYTQYCPDKYDPQSCTRTAPVIDMAFPNPVAPISSLDGTYTFSGFYGASSSAGTFSYQGAVTFGGGALISDYYDFIFARQQVGDYSARITYATGRVSDAALTILYGAGVPTRLLYPIPEPATWLSMIVGFAITGMVWRSRRSRNQAWRPEPPFAT